MKFKVNKKNIKKEKLQISNLFKRFGQGVHLIQSNISKKYEIMIICNPNKDSLFVNANNVVTYIDKCEYEYFDEYYTYIRKLKQDEIIIEIRDE